VAVGFEKPATCQYPILTRLD